MKKIIISVLVLAGLILFFVVDLLRDAGQFKKIEPHFTGTIQKISGVVGAEDITIHPEFGLALISSDDRRAVLAGEDVQGAIFAFDLQAQNPEPVNLTTDFKQPFHPHGISLYVGENGEPRLFVVNHRDATRTDIEVFDVVNGALFHRESIADAKIQSANDLVAVGMQEFYVTLDHGNTSAFGKTLEEYLRLPRSSVLYYDGQSFTKVAAGMKYANGINKSRDGGAIYVAATTDGKIYVYDRNTQSGELTEAAQIDLGTGIDNIEVDPAGNLWIAAHPKLLTFVEYAKDPAIRSPSQVLRITPNGDDFDVEEVFLDDGSNLSGSSVAAVSQHRLLIGSVFDEHFLVCGMSGEIRK